VSVHAIEKSENGRQICTVCLGNWSRPPISSCPGVPLYQGWGAVPPSLKTATAWKKAGRRVQGSAFAVALVEGGRRQRYHLFREDQTDPARPISDEQRERLERGRRNARTCGRCGAEGEVIARAFYHRYCSDLPEKRLCVTCYDRSWAAGFWADRLNSRRWWGERLAIMAAFDVETVGLARPAIIEIAIVGRDGLLYSSLVNPGDVPWEEEAQRVHGLTPADVVDAPLWPAIAAEIAAVLQRAGVRALASWGDFDEGALRFEAGRYPANSKVCKGWIDARDVYDEIAGDVEVDGLTHYPRTQAEERLEREMLRDAVQRPRRLVSLATACAKLGVQQRGAHRAEPDAWAVWELLQALVAPPAAADHGPEQPSACALPGAEAAIPGEGGRAEVSAPPGPRGDSDVTRNPLSPPS